MVTQTTCHRFITLLSHNTGLSFSHLSHFGSVTTGTLLCGTNVQRGGGGGDVNHPHCLGPFQNRTEMGHVQAWGVTITPEFKLLLSDLVYVQTNILQSSITEQTSVKRLESTNVKQNVLTSLRVSLQGPVLPSEYCKKKNCRVFTIFFSEYWK